MPIDAKYFIHVSIKNQFFGMHLLTIWFVRYVNISLALSFFLYLCFSHTLFLYVDQFNLSEWISGKKNSKCYFDIYKSIDDWLSTQEAAISIFSFYFTHSFCLISEYDPYDSHEFYLLQENVSFRFTLFNSSAMII